MDIETQLLLYIEGKFDQLPDREALEKQLEESELVMDLFQEILSMHTLLMEHKNSIKEATEGCERELESDKSKYSNTA